MVFRDPTKEERQCVRDYIHSISTSTDVNFYEYITTSTDGPLRTIKVTPEDYKNRYFPSICDHCSNNPKNGGSGICFCINGTPRITC